MKVQSTPLSGLLVIEPAIFHDERGYFYESFNEKRFNQSVQDSGWGHGQAPVHFVQDNHSCSKRGVVRGLHYQIAPHAQGKLVRVTRGAAWDVAVDIRQSSVTFGQWFGLELSATNQKQFWIPAGFAHGFVALEENTEFLYKTTDFYDKNCERAIRWNDPKIAISWPEKLQFIVNQKDQQADLLQEATLFS